MSNPLSAIEVKGKVFEFYSKTYIMGVLNVTPDSFSDGGKFLDHQRAVDRGKAMLEEGADIIDVGGESSRPGAKPVPAAEELRRVIPVIKALSEESQAILSIDTTKALVAHEALSAGASLINDISALRFDPDMASVVADMGVPLVLMHMRGTPQTMQHDTVYADLIDEVIGFLRERISFAEQAGVDGRKIIIDPGLGFGKSLEQGNFRILKELRKLQSLEKPILIGPSRKAFLGHLLQLPEDDREEATAAAVAVAVMNGADIVRVHDVKKMKRVVEVVDAVKRS
ncbi:MAG: dihydropteroate synthase [Deltaproteobacteria bacterium]|nr:dihydropteroate synthase [Deltaproteobacteria bacterium]